MARQKKIYRIKVNNKLKALGFPTKIIGSQQIIPTIDDFSRKHKSEILELDEPKYLIDSDFNVYSGWDDVPEDAQIEEEITNIEVIRNKMKGLTLDISTCNFVKDNPFVSSKELALIAKYTRAIRGTLKKNDWIGFVHSVHRDNNKVVSNSIIKRILQRGIRYEYIFSFFDIFAEGSPDKESFFEEVLMAMAKHKVYDSIIELMSKEPGYDEETDYDKRRKEIEDKVKLLINQIDQSDEKKARTDHLGLKIYEKDKLFSLNRTRRDKVWFVDNIIRDHRHLLSLDLKEAKIKERLEAESKEVTRGKGINTARKQRILDYFEENPKASNRKAAKDLGYDPRTISKHKLKPDTIKPNILKSDAKNAPKHTILYSIYIVQKGAKNTSPNNGAVLIKDAKFTKDGIRIRNVKNFKKLNEKLNKEAEMERSMDYYRKISKEALDSPDRILLHAF